MGYSIGFDFGTESVRVLIVRLFDGHVAGQASAQYAHGVIDDTLATTGAKLPPDYALQDSREWLTAAARACKDAMGAANIRPEEVAGVGVDFTSCTMLPCRRDGTPLHLAAPFDAVPLAWPRLWKHHGAKAAADRMTQIARQRKEPWLDRYGGVIGLEWFFPKVLETLDGAPDAYAAADVWIEAGDWFVWQLVSGPHPHCAPADIIRSTCQAGYKAMWNSQTGYPSAAYFAAVRPGLADVVSNRMPGTLAAPGQRAGRLTARAAELLGLKEGTPVAAAIIDAHAGVAGAGAAEDGTMVLVIGTSSCHMLNSHVEKMVPGVAGVVKDGILPGYFGYETGQASVGDAFAWMVNVLNGSHEQLTAAAADLPPGAGGVLAIDWLNGCRTPLMDGRLSGAFVGLTLNTKPPQLYRAMLEATAFGLRWIVQTLSDGGVPVLRFVASGGLPGKSALLMQIYADVLGHDIRLASSEHSVALGAAILGRLAGESEQVDPSNVAKVIGEMAPRRQDRVYLARAEAHAQYAKLYEVYRWIAAPDGDLARAMRDLRTRGIGSSGS